MTFCSPPFWRSWEELPYSLETGKTGFEKSAGMPLFDCLAKNQEAASAFSKAMVGFRGSEPPPVASVVEAVPM
jgi:hypothetical protein